MSNALAQLTADAEGVPAGSLAAAVMSMALSALKEKHLSAHCSLKGAV